MADLICTDLHIYAPNLSKETGAVDGIGGVSHTVQYRLRPGICSSIDILHQVGDGCWLVQLLYPLAKSRAFC